MQRDTVKKKVGLSGNNMILGYHLPHCSLPGLIYESAYSRKKTQQWHCVTSFTEVEEQIIAFTF